MVKQFGNCILSIEYREYLGAPTLVFTEPAETKPHFVPAQTVRIHGTDIPELIRELQKIHEIMVANGR